MKLKGIYDIIIREGIKADLRTRGQIQKFLRDKKKERTKLRSSLKKFFDKESLTNPYADTRILYGDPNRDIKRVMVGIDIEVGELILADQLWRKGQRVDLVLAHHPEGVALAGLDEVMALQTDVLANWGVDSEVAGQFMEQRIDKVSRGIHGVNHTRAVDAARLLEIPLLCCHTPADNHVARYLQRIMDTRKPKTLRQVVDILLKEPEYRDAMVNKAGPKILMGQPKDIAGKIFVDMTGGTEGTENVYGRLSQLGVKTYLGMHLSDSHYQRLKSEHMNLVIAGHMASDNLGMNLLLDKIEKKGKLDIIACSGFRRVRR
ncbi:MAG TPA: NGG1p interacting factor NIF3 [Candidatus Omnitrophota bacterium]|nr:NGG1p interacting factor NIF3 [Candidatus Omnitrophota bacterium]